MLVEIPLIAKGTKGMTLVRLIVRVTLALVRGQLGPGVPLSLAGKQ